MFKIGDTVEAFGNKGRVIGNINGKVTAQFKLGRTVYKDVSFLEDGRLMYWHNKPTLKKLKINILKSESINAPLDTPRPLIEGKSTLRALKVLDNI